MKVQSELLAAERAVDDARCGRPLMIDDGGTADVFLAVETLRAPVLEALAPLRNGADSLVLSAERALYLGLATRRNGNGHGSGTEDGNGSGNGGTRATDMPAGGARRLHLQPGAETAELGRLATGPLRPLEAAGFLEVDADAADDAAIRLLKFAWLVPAALRLPVRPAESAHVDSLLRAHVISRVTAASLRQLATRVDVAVEKVSEARIPLPLAPEAHFICFRTLYGSREHLAIIVGEPDPVLGVPVRLHSACLTGDVFGSLRCDCGDQLRQSVAALRAEGGGVLLYLAQEGRGIGLANKLRAYALQDCGRDTIDADLQLGYGPDERHYGVAAAMLAALGYQRIRLMTNNPEKIEALQSAGITILGRLPVLAPVTPQNRRYLDAKRSRARHWLEPAGEDAEP